MLHHAVSLMLGGALHVVELPEKLDRVLDLGTGTGIWAIDMAEYVPIYSVYARPLTCRAVHIRKRR